MFSTVWYVWCLRMLFVKWSEYEDIHWSWAHAGVRAKCWMTTEGWGSPDRLGHQVTHYCYMLRVHSTHRCANQSEWIKPTGSQRIHLAWNDHKPFLTESDETMSWEILDKLNKRMNIKKLFLELGAKMHLSMIFSNDPLTIIQPQGSVGKVWSHLTVIAPPACNLVKTAHPQRK